MVRSVASMFQPPIPPLAAAYIVPYTEKAFQVVRHLGQQRGVNDSRRAGDVDSRCPLMIVATGPTNASHVVEEREDAAQVASTPAERPSNNHRKQPSRALEELVDPRT